MDAAMQNKGQLASRRLVSRS